MTTMTGSVATRPMRPRPRGSRSRGRPGSEQSTVGLTETAAHLRCRFCVRARAIRKAAVVTTSAPRAIVYASFHRPSPDESRRNPSGSFDMMQRQHSRLSRRVSPFGRARALLTALTIALPIAAPLAAQEKVDDATIERIKSEEMNNSHVMDIMSWLSDVYGPRLTWSPNATRAGTWAMSQMKSWGLANVHE